MKMIVVSLLVAILALAVIVASVPIVTAISGLIPDLYFASMPLAPTFTILTMVWGPFWRDLSSIRFRVFQRNRQSINLVQEKKYEYSLES